MTTKPKAKKFRIRRTTPLTSDAPATDGSLALSDAQAAAMRRGETGSPTAAAQQDEPAPQPAQAKPGQSRGGAPAGFDPDTAFDNEDDGFGDEPFATARGGAVSSAAEVQSENDIDAIRREGLTGRQLRMARRVAQKNGIAATSDFDAVRQLRAKGIDPFERSTMLELVIADGQRQEKPAGDGVKLPTTIQTAKLPSTEVMNDDLRAREIYKIQQDIVRRRRRKVTLLFARLAMFVLLPTLVAGFYFYNIATPMYGTKSEFLIKKSEAASPGALGGLFSGTQFATSQDSIVVQSYLQSRDAMLRLDREVGFKSHFSQPWIDPIQRLAEDASNEQAYKLYSRNVTIGYDPTEGVIKMEVVAADPAVSAAFSNALIDYAEQQVDTLSSRLREDQMKGAKETYQDAELKMMQAQHRVLALQEQLGVLDPVSESAALMGRISTFEVQLQEKQLELQQLLDNSRPNQARVDGVRGDIQRLQAVVAELRSQLTDNSSTSNSLASKSGELRMAELDLQTRQMMMQQSLQQLETSRIEAQRQTRYIEVGVSPVAPDEPTYPRKFENTLLAFLVFSGIYLMFSLTASILREQVTA